MYVVLYNTMKIAQLQELGLSDGQISVYSACLELGISTINAIQEKTGIERRNIYDILNKLIERGFISYTLEHGKKTYQCTHPNSLQEAIEHKQKQLKELEEQLPRITSLFNERMPNISAEVFRGNESLKSLLNEILEHKESFWIGGNSGVEKTAGTGMRLWFKEWNRRRVENKHVMHDLVDHGTFLEDYPPENKNKHKTHYYKYCQLPKNLQSPMVIIIFGDKVAQILWQEQSFAFVLHSKEIKESFMKYFNYFWKDL